ncbi:uncharacterized protein N7446_011336 [Penicillium canescens]|uniref:Centrosomin N-terminal motif 1 domain-containing protein n=1 Tax=Penicillium canescens TaxID=5083 RepID=A0AAD6NB75_PENCN|nr:uncharacterized protein N7446_011336 [Penicillium canescens]KAJ6029316.1 hypothetical protein N7444_012303 [Penicillium canescens]KAJ6047747.1 hypothetical protein N7460_003894 [Penicillium canescens]KAJ6048653.1 hypothetical protein N7446_011336 [Penicillium canescens]
MSAAMMEGTTQMSSAAGQPTPSQSRPSHSRPAVYHSKPAPSKRIVSKDHSQYPSERPQHPSLFRVKGRDNMFTPPRMSAEVSWLGDQSPAHSGPRTPSRSCETPEPGTPTLVNPASALLQDLLKEQRAHRSSRGPSSEQWEDAPRTPEGTRTQDDTGSEKARKVNDVFNAGLKKPKEMAIREMDQYVSKMNKLNFDLKLEVFYRAQQMSVLEKKVERIEEMEEELARMHDLEAEVEELRATDKENQKLRESNEQLRSELDKRDIAVTEAVELICQLESKIDVLENGGRGSRMSMSRPVTADGPAVSTPKARTMIEIPERTSSKRNSSMISLPRRQTSSELRKLSKAPSFLRAGNKSTATLRSLYEPEENQSHSVSSRLTKSNSFNTMTELEPESPRLSVLSECSELDPFGTPTRWDHFDRIEIPVRKAPSTTGSLDSYVAPAEREESKEGEIDRWMQSSEDMSQTIITRRRNRASCDASKAALPSLTADLYSQRPRGRGRLDASLFGGVRLPPTPDTMSTTYAIGTNRSNGSIAARRSPQVEHDMCFPGRRLDRPRSADEMTASRPSFDGSEVTDSMQINCSDTPRLSQMTLESPTILPAFNTVSSKASELLGPGSPNNPGIESFASLQRTPKQESTPTIKRVRSPVKAMTPEPQSKDEASPPLTPQDWVAAAKQGPRSRKEKPRGTGLEIQETQLSPGKATINQAAFNDTSSIISAISSEPEVPGIPTLDMNTLDILEQPLELSQAESQPEPESRRRLSFRPPFFSRSSNNGPRSLQASPIPNDLDEDDEDGAPSPIIPKTRNTGGVSRRPMSQILIDSSDVYNNKSLPLPRDGPTYARPQTFRSNGLPPSFTESALNSHTTSATISGRPSTSNGLGPATEHKRRSSLGIFGWMKGKALSSTGTDKAADTAKEPRTLSRLVYESGDGTGEPRALTPDSFDSPTTFVRPHSEMEILQGDYGRRPRYMGRRARRG